MNQRFASLVAAVILALLIGGLILYAVTVRTGEEGWKFVFALLTLVVAAIAAMTGWQQREITQAKLNLDLFERRYDVFMVVWGYLSHVVQSGPPAFMAPKSVELGNLVPQAEFIFGSDISGYMRLIQSKSSELHIIDLRAKANNDVMPFDHIKAHTDLLDWFVREAQNGAKVKFGKYMNFEQWR